MLSSLLLLVASQSVVTAPPPPAPPSNAADMPVIGRSPAWCETPPTRVIGAPTRAEDLMWRQGDPAVGLHLLLDRRVGGCPAPLVVGYRTPGSATDTQAAPTPAPDRVLAPRR